MVIKLFLGTVNYTDYLHIQVAKVSAPGTPLYDVWINTPITNYVQVIPGLDADNYYITFYDAPTNSTLGTVVSQCFISALSAEYEYELRFYTGGALPAGASYSAGVLTDPYLLLKDVQSVEKEGFRTIEPAAEYVFTDDNGAGAGEIDLTPMGGVLLSGEKLVVTIKNNVGSTGGGTSGLYSGILDVAAATYTLLANDKNKRVRLVGTLSKQSVLLPLLSSLQNEDGYYFDNTVGGTALQTKLTTSGSDKLLYNGFLLTSGSNLFSEFWVSAGEHLLIKKNGSNWELILPYTGTNIGARYAAAFLSHPGTLPENGVYYADADIYPKLKWWLQFVLPSTHKVIDNGINAGGWVHPAGKNGMFAVKADYSAFRMPNTQNLSERGIADFISYGSDANRIYDYPGGYQEDKMKRFWTGGFEQLTILKVDGQGSTDDVNPDPAEPNIHNPVAIDQAVFSDEVRVKNIGVIYLRQVL